MQDFVKEPVLGLLKSVEDLAPEELMHGMARGAGSLLNHSVGGVANSVSLITGVLLILAFSLYHVSTVSERLACSTAVPEEANKQSLRQPTGGYDVHLFQNDVGQNAYEHFSFRNFVSPPCPRSCPVYP